MFPDVCGDATVQLMEPSGTYIFGLRKRAARGLVAARDQQRDQNCFAGEIFWRCAQACLHALMINALKIVGRLRKTGDEVSVREVQIGGRQSSPPRLAS